VHFARHFAFVNRYVCARDLLQRRAIGVDARGPDEEADDERAHVYGAHGNAIGYVLDANTCPDQVGGGHEGSDPGDEDDGEEDGGVPDLEIWYPDSNHFDRVTAV